MKVKIGDTMTSCEISVSASDVFAIVAMLFSALSALYARWTWEQSKRANEISLYSDRNAVLSAFFELKKHMVQKGSFADKSEVIKFYYPLLTSQKIFPTHIAKWIREYYDACFWVAESNWYKKEQTEEQTEEHKAELKKHLSKERTLGPKIESELTTLIRKVN